MLLPGERYVLCSYLTQNARRMGPFSSADLALDLAKINRVQKVRIAPLSLEEPEKELTVSCPSAQRSNIFTNPGKI